MGQQRPTAAAVMAGTAAAFRGAGRLGSVLVTPGSDATTVTIHDGTAASGTVLFYGAFVGNAKTELFNFVPGVQFDTGLYVTITGTSPAVICYVY